MKYRLLLSCLLASLLGSATFAAEDHPNVILFLVDDMGWMDSTVYGSEYYETPNMERFAEQSMKFTDAYAVPLCSPTRASILTGQYSSRHGVTSASGHQAPAAEDAPKYPAGASPRSQFVYAKSKNYLDPSFITIAEVLKEAGYRTGHFGKWHLGLIEKYRPAHHGFDVTWQCAPDPGPPSYFSPYGVSPDGRPTGQHHVGNITDGPDGEYITDRVTDEAIAFMEESKDGPFFLNLWHYGVHGPWGHKEEYTKEFAKKTDPRGEQRNPIMASMLKSVDESLGRIMAKVEELGLADNTLFIFYSDNGGNFHSNTPGSRQMSVPPTHPKYQNVLDWKKWAGPEPPTNNAPLREGKGRIYEGGQRVPLMVRWPGKIEAASENHDVVGPIDLYPTILEAVDLEKPADHIVDGESIMPLLKQEGELERDALFTWFPHLIPAASVRQGDWKLIRRFEPHPDYPDTVELYNLKKDIGETNNVAEQHPEKVEQLQALIDEFVEETGALYPKPNPNYQPNAVVNNRPGRDPTFGLVPRSSELKVADGMLEVAITGRNPFLGTAQAKGQGPMKFTIKARSQKGGTGKLVWKTAEQETFDLEGQAVSYELAAKDDWQEVTVLMPVEGKAQTVRIYLPEQVPSLEIASMEFTSAQSGKSIKIWDFTKAKASK
ncbi:N-acetylgalactosamine 6-sulfate sulfatase [Planctomycetales bacterium 10988]|nr:N-acetylgalactosamine 6-sulfate sulfatase [Planctomycetales bacterium 10988]